MTGFDDRLRDALAHAVPPTVTPDYVERVMTDLPARRTPRAPAWIAALTIVLAMALVGGAWASGLIGGPSQATLAPGPTPPGSASVAPGSPSPAALGSWTHVGWRDVSSAFGGEGIQVNAGTAWQGGFVMVGEQVVALPTGVYGIIWSSSDGVAWQRAPDPSGSAFGGDIVGVAATGDTLVAVAQDAKATAGPEQARAWVSHDAGTWTAVPDAFSTLGGLRVSGIAAGPEGFVVYGQAQGPLGQPSHAALLYSPDGVQWTAETVPDDHPDADVMSVVATPDGFAAVGVASGGSDGSARAWWSSDGQMWYSSAAPPVYGLTGLTRWPAGALQATGFAAPSAMILPETTWSSADEGRTWHKVGDTLIPYGDTTFFDDGRLVRLETEAGAWGLWSADGVTWTALRMDGATPAPLSRLFIADGATLVATARVVGGSAVYFGRLDDEPGPTPSPTVVSGSQDTPCKGTAPCGP